MRTEVPSSNFLVWCTANLMGPKTKHQIKLGTGPKSALDQPQYKTNSSLDKTCQHKSLTNKLQQTKLVAPYQLHQSKLVTRPHLMLDFRTKLGSRPNFNVVQSHPRTVLGNGPKLVPGQSRVSTALRFPEFPQIS